MKVFLNIPQEFEVTHLHLKAGVRYWRDATVDGIQDIDGKLIPCRDGDYWCPHINLDTGCIENWEQGVFADIHYKTCDDNEYTFILATGHDLESFEGYVADFLSCEEEGDGDYIVMRVDDKGYIKNWKIDEEDLQFWLNDNLGDN